MYDIICFQRSSSWVLSRCVKLLLHVSYTASADRRFSLNSEVHGIDVASVNDTEEF
jgi:hypothetical protein